MVVAARVTMLAEQPSLQALPTLPSSVPLPQQGADDEDVNAGLQKMGNAQVGAASLGLFRLKGAAAMAAAIVCLLRLALHALRNHAKQLACMLCGPPCRRRRCRTSLVPSLSLSLPRWQHPPVSLRLQRSLPSVRQHLRTALALEAQLSSSHSWA